VTAEQPTHQTLCSQRFDAAAVATLRQLMAGCAATAGLAPARRHDFVLAVDELVTNAVRHGGGAGHLEVWLAGGRIWFQISDHGPGLAQPLPDQPPAPTVLGGRGLWITRQITDELTVVTGQGGTTVTGALDLPL
jgi:anti-sigma regulatory factor (Ser/Thr protein kinase)